MPQRAVARLRTPRAAAPRPKWAPDLPHSARATREWERAYVRRLLLLRAVAVVAAALVAYWLTADRWPIAPVGPVVAAVAGWLLALYMARAYSVRSLGVGPEEFKRLTLGTLAFFCGASSVCYLGQVVVPRSFLALLVPLGYTLLVFVSLLLRGWVQSLRASGHASYTILCVGSRNRIEHLVKLFDDRRFAGFRVVGACVPTGEGRDPIRESVPVVGDIHDAALMATTLDVDVVASTGCSHGSPEFLRDLGWQLEGSGRRLMVAPGILNVAGPRVSVVPVAGVPLVWVDEPEFGTGSRLLKRTVDLVGSLVCLALVAPVMLAVAAAIKVTSRGPVFYRQERTGMHGEPFLIWKFRSMYVDAEAQRTQLADANESTGHLFKIRHDPRVTPVGRFIRRWSIDELPQLFNVVSGEMSLVGPRPLPAVDSDYTGHSRRRLLTLPGITGLWQVNGRSETTWEEAVEHDLYYVDNWSLSLDLVILARTVLTILRGTGAY